MRFVLYFASLSAAVMGIKERKAKEKEDLKQLILDAALELLERDGFDALSIRKIAERIEYAPATIYLYYRDKDQLLYELHNVGFELFMSDLRECLVGETADERLKIMGRKYIEFGLRRPQLYNLMFIVPEPISEENLVEFDGWAQGYSSLNFLKQILAQGMEEGSLPVGDVDISALQHWATVHGLVSLLFSCRLDMIPDEHRTHAVFAAYDRYLQLILKAAPKA